MPSPRNEDAPDSAVSPRAGCGTSNTDQQRKAVLRRKVRHARTERTLQELQEHEEALVAMALSNPILTRARVVTCFIDAPGEPPTGALRQALLTRGIKILLPIVTTNGDEPALDWAFDDGHYRETGYRGVLEPAGKPLGREAVADVDVALIPGLAVDSTGTRLGQGGGYYDSTIPLIAPTTPVVVTLFDEEVFDASVYQIPRLSHDSPVDAALTSRRWVDFAPRHSHHSGRPLPS